MGAFSGIVSPGRTRASVDEGDQVGQPVERLVRPDHQSPQAERRLLRVVIARQLKVRGSGGSEGALDTVCVGP